MAGTVSGHVELVSSHDPNVRKHTDYSGVVVWLEPAVGSARHSGQRGASANGAEEQDLHSARARDHGGDGRWISPTSIRFSTTHFRTTMARSSTLGLYPPGTTKSLAFRREGVVRVFCNIHPTMSAVIVVLKSPYFATSAKNGGFEIANVPAGSYRLHVFHERAARANAGRADAHHRSGRRPAPTRAD